jgi:hypothetical protein
MTITSPSPAVGPALSVPPMAYSLAGAPAQPRGGDILGYRCNN